MGKTLHPKARLELADYASLRHHLDCATSPDPISLNDLFRPAFWAPRHHKISEGDLIRCVGQRREFDIVLVCTSKSPGGLLLEPWPRPAPGSAEWEKLLAVVATAEAANKAELAVELPSEPTEAKKKRAAA